MKPAELALRLRLGNPIFTRELLTTLRRPRGFALLALSIGISAVIVLRAWPTTPLGIINQGELSRTIFELFAAAQMALLVFLVPGTLGPSLTSEKESETIDLLLTTPLGGDMIVSGKLLSGLGFLLLLGLASAPILMLCSVIGGLGSADVVRLYAVLFLQALAYGLTAIAVSALSTRTVMAVMIAYLVVAFEAAVLIPFQSSLASTLPLALGISTIAYAVARKAARRPYNPVPKPPEELDPRTHTGLVLRPDAFPDMLLLPPKRQRDELLRDDDNPMHVKELKAGIHGAGSRFVRILIQLGIFLGLFVFLGTLGRYASVDAAVRETPGLPFLWFVAAFAMTLGPAIGARAFSGEREQGTAEMLCLVLIPRRDVVLGKFTACLRVVATLTAITCVPFVARAALFFDWVQLGVLALLIAATSAFSVAVGFLFSLMTSTTIAAMFRTYLALFALWVIPALVPVLLGGRPSPGLDTLLRVVTPFRAADVRFSLLHGQLPWVPLTCLAIHVGLCLLGSLGILTLCSRRFDAYMKSAAEG